MDKVGFDRGLIRYASYKRLSEGTRLKVTPRMVGYSTVLTGLIGLLFFLMVSRSDFDTTILRTPGVMYEEVDHGMIRNLYSIKVINKTFDPYDIRLKLEGIKGSISMVGGNISLPKEGLAETAFFVDIPKSELKTSRSDIAIEVFAGDKLVETVKSTFLGPRVSAHADDHDEHDRKMNDDGKDDD